MLMDSSGRVGIGTLIPTTELDVSGSINATEYYGDGGTLSNLISFVGATGPAPAGNPGDLVYLISSGVAGATTNVSYTGDGNLYVSNSLTSANVHVTDTLDVLGSMTANASNATFFFDTFTIPYINTQDLTVSSVMNFTGPLATFSNLYVPGAANIEYLSVSNLAVTGNLIITATNVQTTNSFTINNSGTTTALMVYQNETSLHTHNVAEFWDATTLAMVIDPRGNVGIHTTVSPGYALTVTDPANFETLYIRGKTDTTSLNVAGNVYVSNSVTTTNVYVADTLRVASTFLANSTAVDMGFNSLSITYVNTSNLITSNIIASTGNVNVYGNVVSVGYIQAPLYYGDAGFLSNVSSRAIVQPFANLVVSNAVTTTNVFATTANVGTLNVWQVSNLSSLSLGNNLYASNAVTTTNVFATRLNLTTALAVTSGGTGTTTSTGTGSVVLSAAPTLTGTVNIATLNLTTTLAVSEGGTGTTTSTGTGSVVLSAAPTLTGTTNVATLIASGNITSLSDRRIKKDINRIEGALDKVIQIGGYTFIRTDEPHEGQRQAGIIAQEIIKVLPEVVQISEETGYYSVSYGNITALLIEALKEERIERLNLEERLVRLEKLNP
jgi:hypothetical protein